MGTGQGTGKHRRRARGRRPRLRNCLRKGCTRKYQPRCHHQRYCQHPECLRELRRWYGARRQAERRKDGDVKTEHAQAEKARRQRLRSMSQTVVNPEACAGAWSRSSDFFFTSLMQSAGLPRTPR